MTETIETIEQESWLRRNLYGVFVICVYISHSFISEWISFPVYVGAALLIYANVLYFFSKSETSNKEWFLKNSWLKTNLYALAAIGGIFIFIYAIGGLLTFFATLVPERVAATFPAILAIGVILYLIGAGFHLVKKNTKN